MRACGSATDRRNPRLLAHCAFRTARFELLDDAVLGFDLATLAAQGDEFHLHFFNPVAAELAHS
jgi:hypothetical protein